MSKINYESIISKAKATPKPTLEALAQEMYGIPYADIDKTFANDEAPMIRNLIQQRRGTWKSKVFR